MKALILTSSDRLKVSTIANSLSEAIYPDGVQLLSDTYFNVSESGERTPLVSDEPYMMRFLAKPRIEHDIRNRFESGELKLICPISQGFVLDQYRDRTNPFNCMITFDDFVNFAKEYDVHVFVNTELNAQAEDMMNDGAGSQANNKQVLTPSINNLKNEKELTKWLRETWIIENKPSGTAFFNALKKYKGIKGSPIIDHYSAGKKAGITWETSTGNRGDLKKKTILNKVSTFKNTPQ